MQSKKPMVVLWSQKIDFTVIENYVLTPLFMCVLCASSAAGGEKDQTLFRGGS
jgi:hypothetical protein